MELNFNILIGIIRLILLGLFLFFVNKKVLRYPYPEDLLNYIVNRWVRYASICVVLIFILTAINAYDIFTIHLLLTIVIFFYFFEIRSHSTFFEDVKSKLQTLLIYSIRNKEVHNKTIRFSRSDKLKEDIKGNYIVLLLIAIAIITVLSRYYYYNFDVYTLSDLWISDLLKTKSLHLQEWFSEDLTMTGQYALIDFYSKITGITTETALQSFGFLQLILVAVIMYWFTAKLTDSNIIIPTITTLFFAATPLLTPVNIETFLQQRPIFISMSLALPMMVFSIKPYLLSKFRKKYFIYSIIIYMTIALIDLFTALVLVAPFLILGFFFYQKEHSDKYFLNVKAYILAIASILGVYWFAGMQRGLTFQSILINNLLYVEAYTYTPDLILPYNELLNYYQIFSIIVILSILLLGRKQHYKWYNHLLYLVYLNVLLFLSKLIPVWIDKDILNLAFSILIPILIGVSFSIIYNLLRTYVITFKVRYRYGVLLVMVILLTFFGFYQEKVFKAKHNYNITKEVRAVLDAYNFINKEYLPYSYAVVNGYNTSTISLNTHFYMPYEDFYSNYLIKDSIYHAHKTDEEFLIKNPKYIVPETVLLFIYNSEAPYYHKFYNSGDMEKAMEALDILQDRNRTIHVLFEQKDLKLYEIINKPGSSKIRDLIF